MLDLAAVVIDRVAGSVRAGLAPWVRREDVDPVEKAGPLPLDLGQAVPAVEEGTEVDLAGARDAGPDVSVDVARASLPVVLVVLGGGSADKPPMRRRTVP